MKIDGPKKLVKRAVLAARFLGVSGFTLKIEWSDESSEIESHADGSFTIRIYEHQPKWSLMESVAHEMTHLRQIKHGELIELENITIWQGEEYYQIKYMSDEYFLAPWEMEARAMEAWLSYKWEIRKSELH